MRVLVIAAHPDDEVLGCGGTISRLVQESHEVSISILGEGVTARFGKREEADANLLQDLARQSQRVVEFLGAKKIYLHGLPDNRFDTVPLLEVIKIIEDIITVIQPQVIYTHHGADLNIDHSVVHRAVLTATRPVGSYSVREIYAFEVASSTGWAFNRFAPGFNPNVFMDISPTLEVKIQALSFYEAEIRPFPHPRSPEAITATARRWGSVAGLKAAEVFELIRAIR